MGLANEWDLREGLDGVYTLLAGQMHLENVASSIHKIATLDMHKIMTCSCRWHFVIYWLKTHNKKNKIKERWCVFLHRCEWEPALHIIDHVSLGFKVRLLFFLSEGGLHVLSSVRKFILVWGEDGAWFVLGWVDWGLFIVQLSFVEYKVCKIFYG